MLQYTTDELWTEALAIAGPRRWSCVAASDGVSWDAAFKRAPDTVVVRACFDKYYCTADEAIMGLLVAYYRLGGAEVPSLLQELFARIPDAPNSPLFIEL